MPAEPALLWERIPVPVVGVTCAGCKQGAAALPGAAWLSPSGGELRDRRRRFVGGRRPEGPLVCGACCATLVSSSVESLSSIVTLAVLCSACVGSISTPDELSGTVCGVPNSSLARAMVGNVRYRGCVGTRASTADNLCLGVFPGGSRPLADPLTLPRSGGAARPPDQIQNVFPQMGPAGPLDSWSRCNVV